MKIADSAVFFSAQHQKTEVTESSERLEFWRGGASPTVEENGQGRALGRRAEGLAFSLSASSVSLSSQAQSLQIRSSEISADELEHDMDAQSRFEVSLVKLLVEQLTGRKIKLLDPAEVMGDSEKGQQSQNGQAEGAEPSAGFGLRYDYHESHFESEQTHFKAEGVARTEDGREISFDVELNMSREFYTETNVSIRAGDALKDPLVLNFEGNAAELTQRDFKFDLDLDGHEDQIAFVESGSGFLALDKNADGKINDGSELFGPSSGDGFAELAEYDKDKNNWIDENDAVYDRLRIWSQDSDGQKQLIGLGAQGVGAIYLGNVDTAFELKNAENEQLGQVRTSGVFLEEEGGVGTVQQIDLVV